MATSHSYSPDTKSTSCSSPLGHTRTGRLQQPMPAPPPGFAEIAWSLHGDNLLRVVTGIPLELAKDQGPVQMVGSSMLSTWLFRDATSGTMCIHMVMHLMSLVGLGLNPMVDDCHVPTSEKQQIWTRYLTHPSVIVHPFFSSAKLFSSCMFTLMCFICFVFSLNISYIIVSLTNYANGSILLMNTGQILFH